MPKVTDLSGNNGSQQLPTTEPTQGKAATQANSAEDAQNYHTVSAESSIAKFENQMSLSQLINSGMHLKNNLSKKLDEDDKNKTKREHEGREFDQKLNSPMRKGAQIPLKFSASATSLQVLREGLMKCAAQMGLPLEGQEKFAGKYLQNFVAQAKAAGMENLLEKIGDFTLLNVDNASFEVKANGNDFHLILSQTALTDLRGIAQQNEVGMPANGGSANLSLNHVNSSLPENAATRNNSNSHFFSANSQRAEIEARLPIALTSSPEFNSLKVTIQKKVEEILQKLGLSEETNSAAKGQPNSVEDLYVAAQTHEAKPQDDGDMALFATAFGTSLDSSDESRALFGDGVLQEFANYGSEQIAGSKELSQITLVNFLQHGTEAGFATLLESAKSSFSKTDLDGVAHLQTKLGPNATNNLVVGVVTMSVMTREVVAQLSHITQESALGLSDNALAALQKAHNSLRDHLTSTDLIGAVGDLKNVPVEIDGQRYNFLPEVNEALNSLREARNRILSETMYAKSDAGAADSQQRFVRETEVLLGITQRIESFLKIG